jgi:hypothetical protein
MDTTQIICTLKNVHSFLGVFPSDLIPSSVHRSGTIIINTDPHTEKGSHWLAINFTPKSQRAFYFDSYGLPPPPSLPSIRSLLRHSATICDYNTTQLQGPTSSVCGHYCCLFALYMNRGYTPQQFVSLFHPDIADCQVTQLFRSEFGPQRARSRDGGQCCTCLHKRYVYVTNTCSHVMCAYRIHILKRMA